MSSCVCVFAVRVTHRLHTHQHQEKRQKEARHVGSDRVSRARSSGGPDTGEELKMRKIQTGPKGKRTARQVKKLKTQKDEFIKKEDRAVR